MQNPSRPVPTVIEGDMSTEDAVLLQHAYSQGVTLTASFVKQMVLAFGMPIQYAPLRNAILAYSTLHFPSPHTLGNLNVEFYTAKASSMLLRRVKTPRILNDADVFAAMMLAWIAGCKGWTAESLTHGYGCLSIMHHLDSTSGREMGRLSRHLAFFTPLILDNVASVLSLAGSRNPTGAVTFRHRATYYEELCRTGSPPEAWQPPKVEACYNHLRGALLLVLRTLTKAVKMEYDGVCEGDKMAVTEHIIQYIKRKMTDVDFRRELHNLLEMAADGESTAAIRPQAQVQILQFLSMGLQSLELLLSIFEGATISGGLASYQTTDIASRLHSATQLAGSPLNSLVYYRDIWLGSLSLCGMVLHAQEPYECTFVGILLINTGSWLIGQLEGNGIWELAKYLKLWRTRGTYEALIDLLTAVNNDWVLVGYKWR
jgi:hypothetical protein